MTKLKFIILLLPFWFVSCSTMPMTTTALEGTYQYKGDIATGTLVLNRDKSFEYIYLVPLAETTSKGEWGIEKNKLFLKSNLNYKNDYLIVHETKSNAPYIEVTNQENIPLNDIEIQVNNIPYKTDYNGRIILETSTKIAKIEIFYIGISQENSIYLAKDKDSNSLFIKLIEKKSSKTYFNQSFKFKNNSILLNKKIYKKLK